MSRSGHGGRRGPARAGEEMQQVGSDDAKDLLGWVLSPAAAALYADLLVRGEVALDDLAASVQAGVVAELEVLGFVRVAAGQPTIVLPMPPEIPIVRHYVARASAWLQAAPDIGRIEADLRTMTARARPTVALDPDRAQLPAGPIRELPTRSARGVVLNTLMMSARTELYGLQSGHTDLSEDDDGGTGTNVEILAADVLERGVRVRTVYDQAVLNDAGFLTATLDEISAGAEARVVPELATDFIVADNACAMVTTSFAPLNAIYTESPEVIWMLRLLFESLWERAQPIGHRRWAEATTTLTEGHRLVLSMLVNGLNNEAIARTLRLNPRTVRRRIDDLSAAYGVTSRNALIAAAVRQADQ